MPNPRGAPENLKPAKKGEKRNPEGKNGNPKLNHLKKYNRVAVEDTLNEVINHTLPELKKVMKDPNLPGLKLAACRVLIEAIEKGNYSCLNFIGS